MTEDCPTCEKTFDSSRAMKTHHYRVHGETLRKTNDCAQCGETFRYKPDPSKKHKFCSVECAGKAKRNRVTLECQHCGDSFEVPKSEEGRKYCSVECGHADRSKYVKKTCDQCGRIYRAYPSKQDTFCSKACEYENRTDKPRPDDEKMLVWLFYVYEGWSIRYTHKRIRAYLGNENRLYKKEIKQILEDMGIQHQQSVNTAIRHMDPDEFGTPIPAGDDSHKELYSD